ncbi:PspC domain-containing protein, partial [Bacteroidota bacterium]
YIEEEAYEELKNYLDEIDYYFQNSKEKKEIIEDIESRIAEIFSGKINKEKQVINLTDVKEVIELIGLAEEIGEGAKSSGQDRKKEKFKNEGYTYTNRRLYRDPDNKVLGGVCGGMGVYFKFDPVILRVIFVITFLTFGVGLFIYLILWLVIPEARTPAQKCEMRGEPINISNIEKNI